MENVINRILEIDKEARDRLDEAEKQKKQIFVEAKLEEAKIKEDHIKRADARILEVDATEKKFADEEMEKLEKVKLEQISKLDAIYEQNHISWEQDIFQRIVGD